MIEQIMVVMQEVDRPIHAESDDQGAGKGVPWQPVDKVAVGGCSKSSRCKAGKIPRNEAYFLYVE